MNPILENLRQTIHTLEGRTKGFAAMVGDKTNLWQFGIEPIDDHLGGHLTGNHRGGLRLDTFHDFSPERPVDIPSVSSLVLALLTRLPALQTNAGGDILWCRTANDAREYGQLYAPGLAGIGLEPGRFIMVGLKNSRDFAFVLEEALRSKAIAAVVGEGPPLSFTASRRLVLAAQEVGIPCITINTGRDRVASAAATRWRIAPAVGPPRTADPRGPGFAAWSLTLSRMRGGSPHSWQVFWNDETHSFNLVSPLRDGALLPNERASGRILALPSKDGHIEPGEGKREKSG